MGGEGQAGRPGGAPQPGGRATAPGPLALVQAFINTHYDLGADHGAEVLASPEALASWLAGAGLTATPARVRGRDLERALAAREGLRALARDGEEPGTARQLNQAAEGAGVEVRFDGGAPRFIAAPGAGTAGAVGVLLALAAQAIADGTWSRLKICPGHDCGWAFYDHSRNRSGRWCSMSVCGGRAKARTHYRRRHGET